jgi:hypothetical protein
MPRWISCLILLVLAQCSLGAAEPPVRRVAEQRHPFGESGAPRLDLVSFDEGGAPRWIETAVHQVATGACDTKPPQRSANGSPLYPRRTRMLDPRVDERRCPIAGGAGTDASLLGLDGSGTLTWQRALTFVSGERKLDQWLLGATPEGLVLSSLEVWSPASGATLVPARTHPVGPEKRPVPDHQLTGAAIYHAARGEILFFTAEVSLLRRAGGLYRFDPKTGAQELLRPVAAGSMGTHEDVEAMALAPGGRLLLLARRSTVRDASPVSFAVFDLELKRYVFEQRHGTGHACSEPRVTVGPKGKVAFSYRDETDRQHVVVVYELLAVDRHPPVP